MNGKQRVIAAMERKPVDRVPLFPVVTELYRQPCDRPQNGRYGA